MKTLLLTGWLAVAAIGSALADPSCRSPRRFLAIVDGHQSPVFVGQSEEVELVCRPADSAGCRWTSASGNILTDDCQLTTSSTGVFKCLQGGQLIGSVKLEESRYQESYSYRNNYHVSERKRHHTCSDTGKMIEQRQLCDGTPHCDNREDEEGCLLPCGAPSEGPGSSLTTPARQLYPHGAQVTYTCQPGSGFRQTLGAYRRTCREGRWSGSPPVCQRNLALGRPSAASVRPVLGLGAELAVDGKLTTWTMLTLAVGAQSLNVSLPANASVDLVLVRTLNPRYEVALLSAEERTVCSCERSVTEAPELAGMAVCSCPAAAAAAGGGPLAVEILSSGAAFLSFSVAEIAAFEAPSPVADECALLDRPAHGRLESAGDAGVRLVCEAGYRASCGGVLRCGEAASAVCRPVSCPPPPAMPRAVILSNNGTGWAAVTEYDCAAGYQLYPLQQRTTSACRDGLWELGYLSCLPESDRRVVALRLGQRHERSMAAMGAELKTLLSAQQQLLEQTQRRLQRVEQMLGLTWEELEEAEEEEQTREEEEREIEEMEEEVEREEEEREEEAREEEEEREMEEAVEEEMEEEEDNALFHIIMK